MDISNFSDITAMGLLAVVILSTGIPLYKATTALNNSVQAMIDTLKLVNDQNIKVVKDISALKHSMYVAFAGSEVESYKIAAKILKNGDEKDG
jgi:hypothetical protein